MDRGAHFGTDTFMFGPAGVDRVGQGVPWT